MGLSPDTLAEDARERFEALYERLPQWEIDAPQPAVVELGGLGLVQGTLLDAGCGSGENALYFAAQGLPTWGIDVAPTAIGLARAKARSRGLPMARFLVGDALRLDALGLTFDTVIDSGLFHALTEGAERALVADLAGEVTRGRAFGLFHAVTGATLLPASLLTGLLWQQFGASAALGAGGALAALAALGLLLLVPEPPPRGSGTLGAPPRG